MQARRLFVALYAASGMAALVYEVTWTRLLTLQLGHTVAAASTVLAAFMGGLALGAWIAGRVLARSGLKTVPYRRGDPSPSNQPNQPVGDGLQTVPGLRAYATLELLVAIVAIILPFALAATVPLLAWAYADGAAPTRFAVIRVVISLLLLGVPAAAMGATFPIAADIGRDAGILYAANTSGAAVGAIAAGFWLIPAVGLRATTWVGVALNVVAAAGAGWLAQVRLKPDTTGEARSENAGNVRRQADSWSEDVGSVRVQADPRSEDGGSVRLQAGPRSEDGGSVRLQADPRSEDGGSVRLPADPRSEDGGSVRLQADPPRSRATRKNRPLRAPRSPRLASAGRAVGSLRSPRSLRLASPLAMAPMPRLACTAAAVSGFAALVYEVAWTRLLALVIGPTTYAFATMAAAFISGLAIGSAGGSALARRTARPVVWLAIALVVGSVAACAAAWYAATRMPLVVAAQVAEPSVAFGRVVSSQAASVAVLLLPMTLALGATFPLAIAVAGHTTASIGRDAASVYAANTLGAIAGALAGGFVLIPQFGMRSTFYGAAILVVVTGAICLALALHAERRTTDERPPTSDQRSRPTTSDQRLTTMLWPAALAIAALGMIAALPRWDRELLTSGAYKYAPYLSAGDFDAVLRAGTLEYYKEGAAGTVSVRELTGTRSLAIDGKVDASNAGDMLTQRLLGLLPVLLHGHAQDVCVIGLGSGVTLGSALALDGVRRADVVEISPEVVEASRLFDRDSGVVLSNPSVRLIVGDGRSHLLLTPRRYDVIVSEPSNPWMSGVATLFTREFFQAARARLNPDGLLCQWAHTYDIAEDDLRSIVRTFGSVFPQATMWLVGEGDLLLIGARDGEILPRLDNIGRRWRTGAASAALTSVGIADSTARFNLLSLFVGGPHELEQYGDSAIVQTDDHTPLEYSAPRGIYGRTTVDNAAAIRALNGALPDSIRNVVENANDSAWTSRGRMLLRADAYGLAYDAFRRAAALNSRNRDALAGLSEAAAGARKQQEERDWLRSAAAREPDNAALRIEMSRVLAAGGDFEGAVAAATDALRLAPDDPAAAEQLASIFADAGDVERLAPLADALVARFPARTDARYFRASALFMRGKTEDAIAEVRQVLDSNPRHARAQNLLGAACATLGQRDCAQAAFEASLRANPRDPSTYVNLGTFNLQAANPRAAADYFAEALLLDPASAEARNGLAQARSALAAYPE